VFVFEDESLMRWALRSLLGSSREFAFVGESGTRLTDLDLLRRASPHLVVLDVMLPRPFPHGLDVLARIRAELPEVKVAMFSGHREYFAEARHRGAHAIIEKDTEPDALLPKLLRVVEGADDEMPPGMHGAPNGANGVRRDPSAAASVRRLTPREREIGRLVASGVPNGQIATRLAISETTVQEHLKHIFTKLGVHNRADVVRILILGGILDD